MSGRERPPPESWPTDDEPETELPVPEGELVGGKYTIERVFADGGMGIVCLGRHVQLDQLVAVKFLRRALSGRPTIVQRFLNEARALAALRSEHVVRVMDVGQLDSGRPYLVMGHLDGIHLDALLERDGPLSVELAISYVVQVCEPLAEAHALGIVHRDIEPENLFLWSGGLSHILTAAPKSLTEVSPNVDAKLEAIVLRCLEKSPAARYETMSQLADDLNGYLVARQQSQLDAAPVASQVPTRRPPRGPKSKVRIPGVHSRWPGVLVALTVLLGAAVYEADRSGRVRLRDLSDGWLTSARLSDDAAPARSKRNDNRENLPWLRGVSSTDWVLDGAGRSMLRAVPERDLPPRGAVAPQPLEPPITDQERARRAAAYSEHLANEGLTKLSEVEAPSSEGAAVLPPPNEAAP